MKVITNKNKFSLLLTVTFGVLAFLLIAILKFNHLYFYIAIGALSLVTVALINYKWVWYAGLFFLPLSLNLESYIETVSLTVPSDVVALGLFLALIIKLKTVKESISNTFRHPIGIAVIVFLSWMFFCALGSSMPVISIKFFLSFFFYIASFFILSIFFYSNEKEKGLSFVLITISMVIVSIYTLVKHSVYMFSLPSSYTIMAPFYKEHTAYAASLTMIAVFAGVIALDFSRKWKERIAFGTAATIILIAVLFSYTRGAWLGIFASIGLFFVTILWKKYKGLMISTAILLLPVIIIATQVNLTFKETSEKHKSLDDRIISIFNTKTDVSNKERLNRWVSAIAMIEVHPFMGFGPGTYAMQYAPYQQARFRTEISTNNGDNGTTHNEFLLAASEMGILGGILVLLLFTITILSGIQAYLKSNSTRSKYYLLAAICSLVSFYVHGLVNNFMDQDKVGIIVFLCWALIVAESNRNNFIKNIE